MAYRQKRFRTDEVKRRNRRYYWLRKYMQAKGCNHCGYNERWEALQWDHIVPVGSKGIRPGNYMLRRLPVLFAEIRKCQILCANCHSIKTIESKDYGKNISIPDDSDG